MPQVQAYKQDLEVISMHTVEQSYESCNPAGIEKGHLRSKTNHNIYNCVNVYQSTLQCNGSSSHATVRATGRIPTVKYTRDAMNNALDFTKGKWHEIFEEHLHHAFQHQC